MSVEIEDGIEMPTTKRKGKYPWDEMEIGESFATNKLVSTTQANKTYSPKVFKCKAFEGAFRVWRVA